MIGAHYIVRDLKHNAIVGAVVIDADRRRSKRIRLETGEHSGEVLHKNDFQVIEKCETGEAPALVASAWAETWLE